MNNLKDRLFISFSGGKTSAYMAQMILALMKDRFKEIVVGFANTGQEHEKTLIYVDACDKKYGLNVVWLEAVVHPQDGVGTTHKVVDFRSATRDGSLFEAFCAKYGLPNTQFPQCTRELKLRPITSYLRSIGWASGTYNTAIGIRLDELTRMSPRSMENGTIYPLIDWRVTKQDVQAWELKQQVRLGVAEHHGNCTWCWKKSNRKLATVALESPSAFDVPRMLEQKYKDHGAGFGDRRMFRGRNTVDDIFLLAKNPDFKPFVDGFKLESEDMDSGMSCGESCEINVDGPQEFQLEYSEQ